MARPTTICDGEILRAAREVLLARGVHATTAEVAERASVSEGTLFNRFKSKEGLFDAAMDMELAAPGWLTQLPSFVGKGDVRESLYTVGLQALEFYRALLPFMMMSWSRKCREDRARCSADARGALYVLKQMAAFFDAEMRAGRMRRHDPEILARTFIGGVVNYTFTEMALQSGDELPLPAEMFLRGLVNLLWAGVEPR